MNAKTDSINEYTGCPHKNSINITIYFDKIRKVDTSGFFFFTYQRTNTAVEFDMQIIHV